MNETLAWLRDEKRCFVCQGRPTYRTATPQRDPKYFGALSFDWTCAAHVGQLAGPVICARTL